MLPIGQGYFEVQVADAKTGDRYGYSLNNGPVRPDPCSVWQPDGVHKLSALYDVMSWEWNDTPRPRIALNELSFYELHIGTFTPKGTFDAAIEQLPDLVDLGVTAIEILPVAQFPGGRNWGYDGVHLFAAQNSYGGPDGLRRLINAAHDLGLAVFLDVVLNHFGPEGNYVAEFGPYYSNRYTTPWGPAFNFDDRDCDPVRQFALESIWHWIADFRLDGLRLDAVHAMFDISPQHILAAIKQVADAAAASRGGTATIVVESLMNDVRMVQPTHCGGYALDAEWNEDFHHAWLAFLLGERHGKYMDFGDVVELPIVMEQTFINSGRYSPFRGRRWGAPAGGLPGERFVIGVQNHDHIGNRALGERTGYLLSPAMQRLSASLMLLSPFVPLLFMGEEYGETNPFLFFCSFEDPQLIENVRVGRRRDYDLEGEIPDPQAEESFKASKLNWSWLTDSEGERTRKVYQRLLLARRQWPALQDTSFRQAWLWPNSQLPQILVLNRGDDSSVEKGTLQAFFNLTDLEVQIDFSAKESERFQILFRSESMHRNNEDDLKVSSNRPLRLQGHECLVIDGRLLPRDA